jgi:hypothetical protein
MKQSYAWQQMREKFLGNVMGSLLLPTAQDVRTYLHPRKLFEPMIHNSSYMLGYEAQQAQVDF